MNNYIELPIGSIELDISNPRIARGIAMFATSERYYREMKYANIL